MAATLAALDVHDKLNGGEYILYSSLPKRVCCLLLTVKLLLQRKLGFTFDTLRLRLGPKWFNFPLKPGQLGTK